MLRKSAINLARKRMVKAWMKWLCFQSFNIGNSRSLGFLGRWLGLISSK